MLHLEHRRRRGWKRSWYIGGCEPVEYYYTWKWPRDGRMGRDKERPHARIGPRPVGLSVACSQPAHVARRSRSSHKLLKVLVEPLAAFRRTAAPDKASAKSRWVIGDGHLVSQPLERD